MPKSKLMRIFLIAGSVLVIVGVSLLGWMMATDDDRNVIRVQLDDGQTQSIEFKHLGLVPGEECEYTIKLDNLRTNQFNMTLDFVETEEGELKNFARVKILSGDETVCDELLADVLSGEEIVLPVNFKEKDNTELTLVYYMPAEVGNEAKGADAVFELRLTASNE